LGAGSILGILVMLVLVIGAITYAMNSGSMTTASGPSATQSTQTTGQEASLEERPLPPGLRGKRGRTLPIIRALNARGGARCGTPHPYSA
jgi:hypothetical protein